MFVIKYVVTYKDAPKEAQQVREFDKHKDAYGFAIKVEENGGLAVVSQKSIVYPPMYSSPKSS